tara:strand:+ start:891 stop:1916 length:1026 start_codon:yes stop_codon:yes gene_type:complete
MQPLPNFQYLEPETIHEAAKLLMDSGTQSMVISGGTDMLPSMRQGIFSPDVVISLQAIPHLRDVEWDDTEGLKIGPLATLRSLETNAEILQHFPVIAEAAHAVGSPQLREMATVGGNICLDTRCYYYNQSENWQACDQECLKLGGETCKAAPSGRAKKCFAVFSADLAPVLVALDARITLLSARGERHVDLREFYTGDGAAPHVKAPDEILTSVLVPKQMAGIFGVYQKYRIRNSIDYPIAGVALTLRLNGPDKSAKKLVKDVCLVISGVASKPLVVKKIPPLLNGKALDDALIEEAALLAKKAALPLANTGGERAHRKQMIYEFTKKAFEQAINNGSQIS